MFRDWTWRFFGWLPGWFGTTTTLFSVRTEQCCSAHLTSLAASSGDREGETEGERRHRSNAMSMSEVSPSSADSGAGIAASGVPPYDGNGPYSRPVQSSSSSRLRVPREMLNRVYGTLSALTIRHTFVDEYHFGTDCLSGRAFSSALVRTVG